MLRQKFSPEQLATAEKMNLFWLYALAVLFVPFSPPVPLSSVLLDYSMIAQRGAPARGRTFLKTLCQHQKEEASDMGTAALDASWSGSFCCMFVMTLCLLSLDFLSLLEG